jgi:hypothetical protein
MSRAPLFSISSTSLLRDPGDKVPASDRLPIERTIDDLKLAEKGQGTVRILFDVPNFV